MMQQLARARQLYQQPMYYPVPAVPPGLAYQTIAMQQQALASQQLAYQQMGLLNQAMQFQQQGNNPQATQVPGAGPAVPVGMAFNDPFLRQAPANAAPAIPAAPAVNRQVAVRDVQPNPDPARPMAVVEPPPPPTKEEEAARKLKFAKMLANDGITAKAKARFEEIAEKYAGTDAAKEAEQLLAKR
jgi:hypothetical protein